LESLDEISGKMIHELKKYKGMDAGYLFGLVTPQSQIPKNLNG
jgi:hypothetical protein